VGEPNDIFFKTVFKSVGSKDILVSHIVQLQAVIIRGEKIPAWNSKITCTHFVEIDHKLQGQISDLEFPRFQTVIPLPWRQMTLEI
jgi:hypothetical protein